jgi:hypothetical protein
VQFAEKIVWERKRKHYMLDSIEINILPKKDTGATNTGSSIWVPVLVPYVPM